MAERRPQGRAARVTAGNPEWLTLGQAATYLGVAQSTPASGRTVDVHGVYTQRAPTVPPH